MNGVEIIRPHLELVTILEEATVLSQLLEGDAQLGTQVRPQAVPEHGHCGIKEHVKPVHHDHAQCMVIAERSDVG